MTLRELRRVIDRQPDLEVEATPKLVNALLREDPGEGLPAWAEIRNISETLGWNYRQIGDAVGVGRTIVSRWANGVVDPGEARLNSLRKILREHAPAMLPAVSSPAGPKTSPDVEVRAIRERLGWTNRQIGNAVGVTETQVSRWAHGFAVPGAENLQKLRKIALEHANAG